MRELWTLLRVAALIALGAFLISASRAWAQGEPNPPAYFVVIENGGTVQAREEMAVNIDFLLGELTELRRRKATKDVQIHIILSANPTEVSWSGTPEQLFAQGLQVKEMITFRDTCSDLMLAWDQVEITARITMPSALNLIAVGPMIHAGFPCDEGEAIIRLPQAVPADLALSDLALEAVGLVLLGVHADQDEVYLDHFRDLGLLERARAGEVSFDLMDMARARAARGRVLEDH